MKKLRFVCLILISALLLTIPAMAAGSFDAGLIVEREDDTITVTVKDSPLFEQRVVTLTIPCDFSNAKVTFGGEAVEATLKDGKITFSVAQGGVYTITRTASAAGLGSLLGALGSGVAPTPQFSDIRGHWAEAYIRSVCKAGLMNGTSDTAFEPDLAATRGMLMTILARSAGENTDGDPWYQAGMNWAVEAGVSDGTDPTGILTQEQLVTMLWRYAGSPIAIGRLNTWPDNSKISAWARTAMVWAIQEGIIEGMNDTLNPQGTATRSQLAAILVRHWDLG